MFERLRDDVRRIYFFRDEPIDQNGANYNPKMYIKAGKKFEKADTHIENCINNFEDEYRLTQRRYNKPQAPNITGNQFKLLKFLEDNDTTW